MDQREQLEHLLEKYKKSECSEKELAVLEAWVEELQKAELRTEDHDTHGDQTFLGEKIWSDICEKRFVKPRPLWPVLGKVAAVLLVFSSALWYYYLQPGDPLLTNRSDEVVWDTIFTSSASLKKVLLPDSTELWLNANSQLRYSSEFNKNNRLVEILHGEVRFDVTHNPSLPFVVQYQEFSTKVLGTQFTFSAIQGIDKVEIGVTRGRVAVGKHKIYPDSLLKGDFISFNTKTGLISRGKSDLSPFNPEQGVLFINNASFRELSIRIANTYGYRLVPGSEAVEARKYSGDIVFSEDIQSVLQKFSSIHSGSYTLRGKEVFMY